MEIVFWVFYWSMAVAIVVLVWKYLSVSDELDYVYKNCDECLILKRKYENLYEEYKLKYEEDEKIIENIKKSLPFN